MNLWLPSGTDWDVPVWLARIFSTAPSALPGHGRGWSERTRASCVGPSWYTRPTFDGRLLPERPGTRGSTASPGVLQTGAHASTSAKSLHTHAPSMRGRCVPRRCVQSRSEVEGRIARAHRVGPHEPKPARVDRLFEVRLRFVRDRERSQAPTQMRF